MSYYKPKNLLTINSQKTIKSQKRGYDTYIMYLSPHKDNPNKVNLCPNASKGCIAACLFNAGNARFNKVQKGRYNKAHYFTSDEKGFMEQLDQEIDKLAKKYAKKSTKLCIRLNGVSDSEFENIEVREGKNIFELYPSIQFYDYTKTPERIGNTPSNYHLTFSRSEENHERVVEVLNKGGNVAVVFTELPETYLGYPVVNGDIDDLRFLDGNNVVVGLTHKRAATKNGGKRNDLALKSGFVVDTSKLKETQVA